MRISIRSILPYKWGADASRVINAAQGSDEAVKAAHAGHDGDQFEFSQNQKTDKGVRVSHLITSYEQKQTRHEEKLRAIVTFLKQECYSDIWTLMLLLKYKNRQPLDRVLKKLSRLGYIQKHELEFLMVKSKRHSGALQN
ncbi:hypothetical protein JCM19233_3066 [Vibrio astriarenae]|nr:hypothetical protein JCM19233_3066 [Vibrio sp. C7]